MGFIPLEFPSTVVVSNSVRPSTSVYATRASVVIRPVIVANPAFTMVLVCFIYLSVIMFYSAEVVIANDSQ
ncbi:MAG: hypothetical protein ACSHXG_15625 [Maribacter stanieri]